MNFEEQIKLVRETISKAKKPLMFFDNDCDGTSSYFQLKNTFPKIKGYPMKYKNFEQQEEYFQNLDLDTDLIIIFDVPFLERGFFEYFRDKKIIWVDHHPSNDKDLIKEFDVLHLNPLNYDSKDSRPSAYLAYRVCDNKENLFYATIGTFGDVALLEDIFIGLYDYSKDLFSDLFKLSDEKREEIFDFVRKNSFKYEGVENEKLFLVYYLTYEAGYIKFKNLIDFTFKLSTDEEINEALDVLSSMKAKELVNGLNEGKAFPFDRYYETLEIYEKIKKKALKKKDKNGIFIYDYKGEKGFSMTLSDEMNYVQRDSKAVLIAFNKKGKDFYQCSIRSKIDILPMVKKCLEGLNGSGGGHRQAAGVRVSKEDFEIFKNRVLAYEF